MSFVVSLKTENFVIMAGDKRETFVDGSGFMDGCRKVHKLNDYIYGLAGSGELSKKFAEVNDSKNLKDFISYSNDFFNMLQSSKLKDNEHWAKQRFDLTLQIAGIEKNKTFLSMYQISWNEDGILFGVIPSTTREIPCFVMPPNNLEVNNYIENHIKTNHPKTLSQAKEVIKHLMQVVSDASNEVSPEYDFEFLNY